MKIPNYERHVIPFLIPSQSNYHKIEKKGKLIHFTEHPTKRNLIPLKLADGKHYSFMEKRPYDFFKRELAKAPPEALIIADIHDSEFIEWNILASESGRPQMARLHIDPHCIEAEIVRCALLPKGAVFPKNDNENLLVAYSLEEITAVLKMVYLDRFYLPKQSRWTAKHGRPDDMLSTEEAAEYCLVTVRTIGNWYKRGWLPNSIGNGKARRYKRSDLEHHRKDKRETKPRKKPDSKNPSTTKISE